MKHGWSTSPAKREVKNRDRVQHSGITPSLRSDPHRVSTAGQQCGSDRAFVTAESIECAH